MERAYGFRSSIEREKGNAEEYIAVPEFGRKRIVNELPLVKYLAFDVIQNCSQVSN